MLARRLRWLWDELPFVIVAAVVVGAALYLYISPGHWRKATLAIAAAMIIAGILRTVLPASRIGMLAVRARWLDVCCYYALGGAILAVDIRLH
jgi:hypothetical protein